MSKESTAKPDADADAPLVAPIALSNLPSSGRKSDMSDADRKLADAIAATATGENAAVIATTHATRELAEKAAAIAKRLVRRAKVVPEGKAPKASVIEGDGGFRVAIHFGAATVRKPKATPEGEGSDAPTAETPAASS